MSLFVIPMAGLSSRFFRAGYNVPKYMLPLGQQNMFCWAVSSFEQYYESDEFLFIIRNVYDTPDFVKSMVESLGIKKYSIVVLDKETKGQADTVYQGLQSVKDGQDIIIFNIDSRRIYYKKPSWLNDVDGYLEVFKGEGEHWSFVEPENADSTNVIRTTEKNRISDYCSDGLYYFRTKSLFTTAFEDALQHDKFEKGELYVAPLYNYLISHHRNIRYDLIQQHDIQFCGTPEEYTALLTCIRDGAKSK